MMLAAFMLWFWIFSAVVSSCIDWIEGFRRCLSDREGLEQRMNKIRARGGNPRVQVVITAFSIFLFMGPFALGAPAIVWKEDNTDD